MKQFLFAFMFSLSIATHAAIIYTNPDPIQVQVCRRVTQLVKLSPNPSFNGMLTVFSESKEAVHFYVFDVEGVLLFHALLSPGEKRAINDLKKGAYSYDVFYKDESVEQGKILVH